MLRNLRPDLKPQSISYGFVQAAIKSIKYAFFNVRIYDSLFYLSKIFKKQVGQLSLQLDITMT